MTTSPKKILVADDDPDIVHNLTLLLEYEGYEVHDAGEGVRVIALAHKIAPDLILLDLMMPAGDGESVLKALRTQAETRRIPVIIITGVERPNLENDILSAGAYALIHKPYDPQALVDTIQNILL